MDRASSPASFDYAGHFAVMRLMGEVTRDADAASWLASLPREVDHHRYVVWLGCNIIRTAHIADTLAEVLRALGTDFVALGGPSHCCGTVHRSRGEGATGDDMLRATLAKFDRFTPERLLNWCPSCDEQLEGAPADMVTTTAAGRASVTRLIGERFADRAGLAAVPLRIALHAHGGSPKEEADAADVRAMFERVPGLEIVDVAPILDYGRHCSDANVKAHAPGGYVASARAWAAAARAAGATAIVSVYHSCHRFLLLAQRELPADERIGVVNYLTLVARALGLPEREDRFAHLSRLGSIEAMVTELASTAAGATLDPARIRRTLTTQFAALP